MAAMDGLKAMMMFAGHAISSVGLSLINKQLMLSTPSESEVLVLLVVQTLFASVVNTALAACNVYEIKPLSQNQFRAVLPVAICFALLIHSGLKSLASSHIALVVVFRNLSPLATAVIDGYVHRKRVWHLVPSLSLMVVGACLYATGDFEASLEGYFWLSVNLLMSAVLNVLEGRLTRQLSDEQTPIGVSQVRNLLSLVVFCFCILFLDNTNLYLQLAKASYTFQQTFLILLSCIFGYSIGMFYFVLQSLFSPTSISVANCSYKILTVTLSIFMFHDNLRLVAFIGLALSFTGVFWYILHQTRPPAPPKSAL